MNRILVRLIPILALLLVFVLPSVAQNPSTKVGIIDIQQAIIRSNEGQRDFAALSQKFDPIRTDLERQNKELEDLKKQLQAQQDKLNDETRANMVKDIDRRTKDLQRKFEDANADFQQQQNEIAQRIGQKMMQVVDKYAKDNAFSLILDIGGQASPVIWAAPTIDVTQAIIDQYNTVSGVPAQPKPAAPAPANKPR